MDTMEVLPNRERLIQAATEHIARLASETIMESGMFTVALSGGSTPRPIYALLASERFARRIDWQAVHIFWSDERCVPPDALQSNYRMARETLLDAVPLTARHIHRILGEEDPHLAAAAYEEELRIFFGARRTEGLPGTGFDLILLGMGDDGHTASLFPGLSAMTEKVRWVMAQYVESLAMWRITLTPVVINAAKNVTFIVSGAGKAERLRDVLEGPIQTEVLPAQIIKPVRGRMLWLVDKAAAGHLKKAR